jgi:NAD(P)-dependent dehydrogenase (short-subunit alcohol dehydrogenase family)
MRFQDKVVVVTGGAQGIGKEIALQFAKEKAKVVIFDLNEEQLIKANEE